MELGVQYLTIYSFSSENWARPASEIDDLMGLMRRFIRRDLAELHQNGVRIGVIGERDRVDPELLALIDEAVALTSGNSALNLQIAFNYGSRAEIARAARAAGGASAGRRDQAAGHHARGAVGCA
jgi:undecaprenyl diphosphate synthase